MICEECKEPITTEEEWWKFLGEHRHVKCYGKFFDKLPNKAVTNER